MKQIELIGTHKDNSIFGTEVLLSKCLSSKCMKVTLQANVRALNLAVTAKGKQGKKVNKEDRSYLEPRLDHANLGCNGNNAKQSMT